MSMWLDLNGVDLIDFQTISNMFPLRAMTCPFRLNSEETE